MPSLGVKIKVPSTEDAAIAARITGRFMEEDPRLSELVCNLIGAQLEISTYVKSHYQKIDAGTIDVFLFCAFEMAMRDIEGDIE